jgi:hypothetical protein
MRKAAEWSERVSAWKASGQTAEVFARTRGLSPRTLVWWASRLRHGASAVAPSTSPAVPMARVVRTRDAASSPSGMGAIVIEVGSARVLVHGEPSATALRSVLAALRAEAAR